MFATCALATREVCMWLCEISSCSCLTVLPGPALVLLSKTNKPLFSPLYAADQMWGALSVHAARKRVLYPAALRSALCTRQASITASSRPPFGQTRPSGLIPLDEPRRKRNALFSFRPPAESGTLSDGSIRQRKESPTVKLTRRLRSPPLV